MPSSLSRKPKRVKGDRDERESEEEDQNQRRRRRREEASVLSVVDEDLRLSRNRRKRWPSRQLGPKELPQHDPEGSNRSPERLSRHGRVGTTSTLPLLTRGQPATDDQDSLINIPPGAGPLEVLARIARRAGQQGNRDRSTSERNAVSKSSSRALVRSSPSDTGTHYCHTCNRRVTPDMPNVTCPHCQGGFVEVQDQIFLQPFFQELPRGLPQMTRITFISGFGPRGSRGLGNPMSPFGPGVLVPSVRPDGTQRTGDLTQNPGPPPQDLIEALDFITQLLAPPPTLRLNVHLPMGVSDERLDAIITQLLEELEGGGPPPMTEEQIRSLPTVKISDKEVKKGMQCSICMEDFVVGDDASQLPCEHLFHNRCIVPWLQLHGSCPVCRTTTSNEQQQAPQQQRTQQGASSNRPADLSRGSGGERLNPLSVIRPHPLAIQAASLRDRANARRNQRRENNEDGTQEGSNHPASPCRLQ
ncbi:unnamed protein product [Cyprideis torosa]|uniref:RING-type E3 ubiquitin transferase n=1 Tax=Cyprideis torosa TaxID=163714 RepID=A0A7R8WCQ5_9CRUS|nr:unnamed protein product [Cyprideis torosa]CAG0892286.1 unnamed protein product [Cyprideis torosa]